MTRYAHFSADTTVIGPGGRGVNLPAGTYRVAELDGLRAGELFLHGPDGLVKANPHDPNLEYRGEPKETR